MNRFARSTAITIVLASTLLAAKPIFTKNPIADFRRAKDRQEIVFAIGENADKSLKCAATTRSQDPQKWAAEQANSHLYKFIGTLDENAANEYVSLLGQARLDVRFWDFHTRYDNSLKNIYRFFFNNYYPRSASDGTLLCNGIRDIETTFLQSYSNYVSDPDNIIWVTRDDTEFKQFPSLKDFNSWWLGTVAQLSSRYNREFVMQLYALAAGQDIWNGVPHFDSPDVPATFTPLRSKMYQIFNERWQPRSHYGVIGLLKAAGEGIFFLVAGIYGIAWTLALFGGGFGPRWGGFPGYKSPDDHDPPSVCG